MTNGIWSRIGKAWRLGGQDTGFRRDVDRELLRQLYANTPRASPAHLTAGLLYCWIMRGQVPLSWLGIWYGGLLLLIGVRLLHARWRVHGYRSAVYSPRLHLEFDALALLTGLFWSLGFVVYFPLLDPAEQAINMIFLMGVAAGSLAVFTLTLSTYLLFHSVLFLPPLGYLLFVVRPDELRLVWLLVAALLMFPPAAIISHYRFRHAVTLRFQNERLARRLAVSNRDLQQANQRLDQMAKRDALTGVANRHYFHERGDEEIRRALRARHSIAFIMIDIDYFKAYNDALGHAEGDTCLIQVAAAIQRSVTRAGDLVVRLGGEEFGVLLPDTALPAAMQVAENIRLAVEGLGNRHPRSPVAPVVTVSAGVSAMVPDSVASLRKLVNAADEALYEAKGGGRNQVQTRALAEA